MRIAQITPSFPPHPGGMGYVCLHYSIELAKRGHDVTVFSVAHPVNRSDTSKWPFTLKFAEPLLRHDDGGLVPGLVPLLGGFDMAHLHFPFYGGSEFVYLAYRLKKQRYMVTYHMDCRGNTALKRIFMAFYEPLVNRFVLRNASLVTSPGPDFLKASRFGRLVNPARVATMTHAGVDTELFKPRPKRQDLIKKHGLAGKTVGIFVGNLQPFKGLHVLIDAVAKLNQPDFKLLIVGGGYDEAACRQHVHRLGLEERVVFAGPQKPDGDLPAYYNLADFLVLPSTYSESYGLVVLEAMASGIPAIVSDLPGPAQLVIPNADGLIVPPDNVSKLADAITTMTRDGNSRQAMGAAGRQKMLGTYTWEAIGFQLDREILMAMEKPGY